MFPDELSWRKTLERLQSSGMVVGINEDVEVSAQLLVIVIVEVFDSGLLDCAVPLPGNGLPANREWDALDLTAIRENSPQTVF